MPPTLRIRVAGLLNGHGLDARTSKRETVGEQPYHDERFESGLLPATLCFERFCQRYYLLPETVQYVTFEFGVGAGNR
ncbi:MAG: hypothetical protein AAF752_15465 [Bacteroidota bacterium]